MNKTICGKFLEKTNGRRGSVVAPPCGIREDVNMK